MEKEVKSKCPNCNELLSSDGTVRKSQCCHCKKKGCDRCIDLNISCQECAGVDFGKAKREQDSGTW